MAVIVNYLFFELIILVAIFFVAPLLITALSVPLLGESVGPRRWAAVVAGLIGVVVMLHVSPVVPREVAAPCVLVRADVAMTGPSVIVGKDSCAGDGCNGIRSGSLMSAKHGVAHIF